MLIVKQVDIETYRQHLIGTYKNLRQIFEEFSKKETYDTRVWNMFSFNPRNTFRSTKEQKRNWFEFFSIPIEFCMTIENEYGIIYSDDLIKGEFKKFKKEQIKKRFKSVKSYNSWRKPHSRGHYYKHPKTIQERKYSVHVLKEEGEPEWRKSRNFHNLPSSYDDLSLLDWKNDNWKRYRKTQYKVKKYV